MTTGGKYVRKLIVQHDKASHTFWQYCRASQYEEMHIIIAIHHATYIKLKDMIKGEEAKTSIADDPR